MRWRLSAFLVVVVVVPAAFLTGYVLLAKERTIASRLESMGWEVRFDSEFHDESMSALKPPDTIDRTSWRNTVWSCRKKSGLVARTEVEHIGHLRGVRSVSVASCEVEPAAVATLCDLDSVEEFDFAGTELTESDIREICGHSRRLRSLDLQYLAVGDGVVSALLEAQELRTVNLRHTQVTREGVHSLRGARPGIVILSSFLF
jgi:hypothetical protein